MYPIESIDIPNLDPNIQVTILYQNMALMIELMIAPRKSIDLLLVNNATAVKLPKTRVV
jgi:hypothetical protein